MKDLLSCYYRLSNKHDCQPFYIFNRLSWPWYNWKLKVLLLEGSEVLPRNRLRKCPAPPASLPLTLPKPSRQHHCHPTPPPSPSPPTPPRPPYPPLQCHPAATPPMPPCTLQPPWWRSRLPRPHSSVRGLWRPRVGRLGASTIQDQVLVIYLYYLCYIVLHIMYNTRYLPNKIVW